MCSGIKYKICYIGIDFLDEALKVLLERSDVEIIKIFTCKTDNVTEFNTEVCRLARENAIPLQLEKINETDLQEMYSLGCNLVISSGYYYKIPVLDCFPMINIHPALLPVGRGAWPMPISIMRGFRESGITIHKINDSLDCGDIIVKESFEVSPKENLISFMKKDAIAIRKALNILLDDFETYYNNAVPQGEGEYWEMPSRQDYSVSTDMSDEKIDLVLRAYYSYEVYLSDGNREYELIFGRLVGERPAGSDYFVTRDGSYIVYEQIREVSC